ncbi:MAG: glycosyltransferase, partial [Hadesarchaea archaeon]|nr:glycosyltransferase [Hadesarchaea archaeon]
MRVLHIAPVLDWVGGVETYLINLVWLLEKRGHPQVVIFGKGDRNLVPSAYLIPQVNKPRPRRTKTTLQTFFRIVKEHKPDLIHVHHIANLAIVKAAVKVAPCVVTTHGYHTLCPASDFFLDAVLKLCDFRHANWLCFINGWRYRCLSRHPLNALALYRRSQWLRTHISSFRAVICPSCYTAERHRLGGIPSEKIEVLPYFCPLEPRMKGFVDGRDVLFMGRLAPYKGYHVFLKAIAHLDGVSATVVGDLEPRKQRDIQRLVNYL